MYTLQQYITPILSDLALAALGIAAAAYGIRNEVREHRRRSAMAAKFTAQNTRQHTMAATPAHGVKAEGMGSMSAQLSVNP